MKFKYDDSSKNRFSFPASLTPDLDDGGYVVTFLDLPEAITQSDSIKISLQEATVLTVKSKFGEYLTIVR